MLRPGVKDCLSLTSPGHIFPSKADILPNRNGVDYLLEYGSFSQS